MDYSDALKYLDTFVNYEKKAPADYAAELSLDRIRPLLEKLGNPQQKFQSIHVAGTKGKGSTCAIAASILRASGVRTGLYTSPHLRTIRERIQVGGQAISEADFAEVVGAVRPHATPETTYFDLMTACAFLYFAKAGVEAAVIETGLGGRLDSTNVLSPLVTGLTPISLDHMEQLGPDLQSIAREKAGILKPGVPAVVSPQPEEAMEVFEESAASIKAPLHLVEEEVTLSRTVGAREGSRFHFKTPVRDYGEAKLPLLGWHQIGNALAAVRLAELWAEGAGRPLTAEAVREGLSRVEWPGRCQWIGGSPSLLLDGAHNADSAEVLREVLEELFSEKKVRLVIGVSAGKDLEGIVRVLAPITARVIATKSANPRAEAPATIANLFRQAGNSRVETADSVEGALQQASQKAGEDDMVVVTGSLFVVGEALELVTSSGAIAGPGKETRR